MLLFRMKLLSLAVFKPTEPIPTLGVPDGLLYTSQKETVLLLFPLVIVPELKLMDPPATPMFELRTLQ